MPSLVARQNFHGTNFREKFGSIHCHARLWKRLSLTVRLLALSLSLSLSLSRFLCLSSSVSVYARYSLDLTVPVFSLFQSLLRCIASIMCLLRSSEAMNRSTYQFPNLDTSKLPSNGNSAKSRWLFSNLLVFLILYCDISLWLCVFWNLLSQWLDLPMRVPITDLMMVIYHNRVDHWIIFALDFLDHDCPLYGLNPLVFFSSRMTEPDINTISPHVWTTLNIWTTSASSGNL